MRRISVFPSRHVTEPGAVRALYDAAAGNWQDGLDRIGYGAAYAALADRVATLAPAPPQSRVLDAGTGTGAMAQAFCRTTPDPARFDLLDLSPEMLRRAADRVQAPCHAILGAIGTGDVPADHYDRVLCAHVIEHLDAPLDALRWLAHRLKPGGYGVFAISKPHWCTALVRWKYGSAAYRPEAAEAMLAQTGFCDIHRLPHAQGPPSRISCGYLARRSP